MLARDKNGLLPGPLSGKGSSCCWYLFCLRTIVLKLGGKPREKRVKKIKNYGVCRSELPCAIYVSVCGRKIGGRGERKQIAQTVPVGSLALFLAHLRPGRSKGESESRATQWKAGRVSK